MSESTKVIDAAVSALPHRQELLQVNILKPAEPTKVIDVSAVLGVKVICSNAPAENLIDRPISAETHFDPGARSADHIHPKQDESYYVLSGTLDLLLNKEWRTVGPGQSISIPRGTVHAFRNSTDQITRAINTHSPGLRFQEYLEAMERLIQEGKVTSMTGLRSGIYLSLHSLKFSDEAVLVQPPYWLRRLMAGIGRMLGYRI